MVRPVKNADDGSQACPDGYLPCNPQFLNGQSGLLDYVVCYKEGEKELTCPITDLQFKPQDSNDQATYIKREYT